MNGIFRYRNTKRQTRTKSKLNMKFTKRYQIIFGTRSVGNYSPKIWNALKSFQCRYQILG